MDNQVVGSNLAAESVQQISVVTVTGVLSHGNWDLLSWHTLTLNVRPIWYYMNILCLCLYWFRTHTTDATQILSCTYTSVSLKKSDFYFMHYMPEITQSGLSCVNSGVPDLHQQKRGVADRWTETSDGADGRLRSLHPTSVQRLLPCQCIRWHHLNANLWCGTFSGIQKIPWRYSSQIMCTNFLALYVLL